MTGNRAAFFVCHCSVHRQLNAHLFFPVIVLLLMFIPKMIFLRQEDMEKKEKNEALPSTPGTSKLPTTYLAKADDTFLGSGGGRGDPFVTADTVVAGSKLIGGRSY
jgi:hypothetical protein